MLNPQDIFTARILLVDDKPSNIQVLEQLLAKVGYTGFESTTDPCQVCTLHRNNSYHLIVLDLEMPVMDGFEVIEGLKVIEKDCYLSVLALTAQPEHKLRALSAGAKDFVTKPFDLIEIETRIRNLLEVRLLYNALNQYNQHLEKIVIERTAALRASEERFRRYAELSSDWYWEQDSTGRFTQVYGPVQEMLGILEQGNILMADKEMVWNEAERSHLARCIAERQPFLDFVYSRINAGGDQTYFMVSGEPMFDASGRFTGYRGVGKEVPPSLIKSPPIIAA